MSEDLMISLFAVCPSITPVYNRSLHHNEPRFGFALTTIVSDPVSSRQVIMTAFPIGGECLNGPSYYDCLNLLLLR